MPLRKFGLLGVVLLVVVGCQAASMTRSSGEVTPLYDPVNVWQATRGTGFQTVVHGNPFGGDDIAAADRVIRALKLPNRFDPAPFVKRPVDAPPSGYRLVLVFNPAHPGVGFQAACDDVRKVALGPRPAEAVLLHAAFCTGSRSLSELTVAAPLNPVGDQALADFLGEALEELLPSYTARSPSSRL